MHIPDQRVEICRLLTLSASALSGTRRTRVSIIEALYDGFGPSEISRYYGVSREAVRKIRNQIRDDGLDVVLAKIARATDRKNVRNARPPRPRGRPKILTFRAALTRKQLRGEPVVALVSLVVAADAQVAVIGVREEAEDTNASPKGATPPLLETILNAFNKPERVRWTRGYVDEWLRRPFLLLRWDVAACKREGKLPRCKHAYAPKVTGRFSVNWKFIVLQSGQDHVAQALTRRLMEGRSFKLLQCERRQVIAHLEEILYTLRITHNLRGLVPYLDNLTSLVWEWHGARCHEPLEWHATEEQTEEGLKNRIIDFHVREKMGALYDLTPTLLRSIPRSERFRIGAFRLKPKISLIDRDRRGDAFGVYEPFPGIEMPLSIAAKKRGSLAKLEKELRARLAARPKSAAFEYAVRPAKRQRRWMYFTRFLLKKREHKKFPDTIAIVLVPRHFLMPGSTVPLKKLVEWGRNNSRGRSSDVVKDQQGKKTFIFRAPKLLSAIENAFRSGRYAGRLELLAGNEEWWRPALSGPSTEIVIAGNRHREFGRVGELFPPFRCLSDEELAAATWYQRQLDPSYNNQEILLNLYRALDADFLLREIDDADWEKIIRLIPRWSNHSRKIIKAGFFPKKNLRREEFSKRLPGGIRSLAWTDKDKAQRLATDALQTFELHPRILREIVENAQRCALENLPLTAIAVRTEAELRRDWERHFKLSVRQNVFGKRGRARGTEKIDRFASSDDVAEEIASREGENQICQVLSKIGRGGSDDILLCEFANLAVTFGLKEWMHAYQQIETHASPASLKNLGKALKIVKASGYAAGPDLSVAWRHSLRAALKGFKVH